MLSRSVNEFAAVPPLLAFKNKEAGGRIILVYCDDERISLPAAHLFFEKGFDNVFLLTGGLHSLAAACPHFVRGAPPPPPPQRLRAGERPYSAAPGGGLAGRPASGVASRPASARSRRPLVEPLPPGPWR